MKNFTISLYAFHLERTFIDPVESKAKDADSIWSNLSKLAENNDCFKELDKLAKLTNSLDLSPQIQDRKSLIKDGEQLELGQFTSDRLTIQASLQAYNYHDTYFADLSLYPSTPQENIELTNISSFYPKNLILSNIASLGQTVIIYAEIDANKFTDNIKTLANNLVKSCLKDTEFFSENITASNTGKLFGINLFEYFGQTQNNNSPETTYHLIVLLNQSPENSKKLGEYYHDFAELLCTYHKILFIDKEAKDSYSAGRSKVTELSNKIEKIKPLDKKSVNNESLEEMNQMLKELPELSIDYSRYYGELHGHQTSLETNIQNYRIYLDKLSQENTELECWKKWIDQIEKIYLKQISTYINYLTPSQALFQQLTSSIRGIVEIEQAKIDRETQKILQDNEKAEKKRDQDLQDTIQSLSVSIGVGIGVAGVFAGSFSIAVSKDYQWQWPSRDQPFLPPHPFIIAFFGSLALGWIARNLAKNLVDKKLKEKRLQNQNPSNTLPSGSQQEVNIPVNIPGNNLSEREEQRRSN